MNTDLEKIRDDIFDIVSSTRLIKQRITKINEYLLNKDVAYKISIGNIGRKVKYPNSVGYYRQIIGYKNRKCKLCVFLKLINNSI